MKLVLQLLIFVPTLAFGVVAQQSYLGSINSLKGTITLSLLHGDYSSDTKQWWKCYRRPEIIVNFKNEYDWQVSGGCDVFTVAPGESVKSLQKRIFSIMKGFFSSPPSAIKLSSARLETGERCAVSSLQVAGTFVLGDTLTISFGLYNLQGGPFPPRGDYLMSIAISRGHLNTGKVQSFC